jgi:glyoxylase-like metal-dependent hydrolase (beta-lactamase superfamily II)
MTTARVPATPDSGADTGSGQPAVRVDGFALGPYQTNCYIVWPTNIGTTGQAPCWIVDASFGPAPLVERVKSQGLSPQALVLTHAHVDHIAGVAEVVRAFPGLPVWIHGAERAWLTDPMLNLSGMGGVAITAPGPDRELADGDELTLGPTRWRVLHTPGHSPGGVTLYHEPSGLALVGDSLFAGSIGRTDLPGGDHDLLLTSIREKLYTLPKATRVLPGHGPETTIGRERVSNPYVRG